MKSITLSEKIVNNQLHLNVPDEFNNKNVNVTITESENSDENLNMQEPTVEYLITLSADERKKYLQKAAEESKDMYNNDDRSDLQSGDFYNY